MPLLSGRGETRGDFLLCTKELYNSETGMEDEPWKECVPGYYRTAYWQTLEVHRPHRALSQPYQFQ